MAKLIGNPWHCDKSIYWLTLWMKANQVKFFSPDHMTCASPPKLKGKRIVDLDPTILPRVKRPGKVKPNVKPIDIPFHYGKRNFTVAVNFSTDENGNIENVESELLFNDNESEEVKDEINESGEVTEKEIAKLVPDETSTQAEIESQTELDGRFGTSSRGLFELPTQRNKPTKSHSGSSSEVATKAITTNTQLSRTKYTTGDRSTDIITTHKPSGYSRTSTKEGLDIVTTSPTITVANIGKHTTSKPVLIIDQPEDLGLEVVTGWPGKEHAGISTHQGHSVPSLNSQGITSLRPTNIISPPTIHTTPAPLQYTPLSHSNNPSTATTEKVDLSTPFTTQIPPKTIETHAMPYHNNAIIKNTVTDKYRKHKSDKTFNLHQWKKPHKTIRSYNTDPNVGHVSWRSRHRYSEGSGTHHRPHVLQHIIPGQGVDRGHRTQSHTNIRRNIFSKLFPNQTIPHIYRHGDGSGNLDHSDKDHYIPLRHVRKGLFYNAYIRQHAESLNNSGEDRT